MSFKNWAIMATLLLIGIFFFLFYDVGDVRRVLILQLRATKLLGLLMVAMAISISTLIFQTLTHNSILTPSILGFDSLFILLQTLLLFILGGSNYVNLNIYVQFSIELTVMCLSSLFLFSLLRPQNQQDLTRLILVGVIFGVLFRSLSYFLQRMLDPEEFLMLQLENFAHFNTINEKLLFFSTLLIIGTTIIIWQLRNKLDILMLGREKAIGLGISYHKISNQVLILSSILIATATALVGPISFFGLLVCAVINKISKQFQHRYRIPAAIVLAMIILVIGQTIFEHFLNMKATLSVVIDFIGGLVFLLLLIKNK